MPAKSPKSTPVKPAGRESRTAANAARRIARHMARHPNWKNQSTPCPIHQRRPVEKQFVILSGQVPEHKGDSWYAAILDGRILSCGSYTEADSARKESMDGRAYLIRRTGSTLTRIATA